uniref:Calmodulin-binding transcription activator 4 n=1 Tax=Anthurium amnicola TaxID=1678845 RepID=A0A1D1YWA6_9ARAE
MQRGFDIGKLFLEAQRRWLRPSEILFILQNHEKCKISPEPPNKPPSGSLYLFNKRVLRFFRKDGHTWRKKKDGRTIAEAHERLKVGNVDALTCYYAHGEENPFFQRRSYWMLDPAYEHIVLVHYREIVEGRGMSTLPPNSSSIFNLGSEQNQGTHDLSFSDGSVEELSSVSTVGNNNNDLDMNDRSENSLGPPQPQFNQALGILESHLIFGDQDYHISDEEKLSSYQTLENMQSNFTYGANATQDIRGTGPSVFEYMQNSYHFDGDVRRKDYTASPTLLQSAGAEHFPRDDNQKQQFQSLSSEFMVQKKASPSWKEMLELTSTNSTRVGTQETSSNAFTPDVHQASSGTVVAPEKELPTKDMRFYGNDIRLASSEIGNKPFSSCEQPENLICQQRDFSGNNEGNIITCPDPESNLHLQLSAARRFLLGSDNSIESPMSAKPLQYVEEAMPSYTEKSIFDGDFMVLSKESTMEWMDNMHFAVENTAYSSSFSENLFDQSHYVEPLGADSGLTVAQQQLFSIHDVSPEWAFSLESTKVIITGDFLCNNYLYIDWKVMFGDIEVSVEIIHKGVIRCQAPPHVAGMVSLCVTSGNRESCSEVRDFEYRMKPETPVSESNVQGASSTKSSEELLLIAKFTQILLCGYDAACLASSQKEENDVSEDDPSRKLKTTNDQWVQVIYSLSDDKDDTSGTIYWLLQELLKDKLKQRLSSKSQENVIGVWSLSKQEQNIIHMISGLGFEWALSPLLNVGVSVNFRDANGWAALHWAARFGREKMVAALLAAGASAGAVTDPTAQDPVGKTPASIAAANGHKGLAGYLSEVALTSHLSSLTLEEIEISRASAELVAERAVESISERSIQVSAGATEDQLSLKDSLAAVRNATQAAARIQSAFRAHSFRKKQQKAAQSHDQFYPTPQRIHEFSAASKLLHGHRDQKFHTAALCIQRKYRGWEGRRKFLTLRQHVVKIQAHVRGHQARRKYVLLWAVSVVEKVVLRWRRRGVGLRGFKVESEPIDEIEADDILKIFRKQKVDAALDEAVSRVLSIVESPEARQQYRRMLGSYQLAKAELESASEAASSARGDHDSRETNEDMFLTLDEMWNQLDPSTMG